MSFVRRALPFCLALALAATAQAATNPKQAAVAAPAGLQGFLLRADRRTPTDQQFGDSFPRTPSFAWRPVAGARKYDFQLSISERFVENGIVWSGSVANTPAISVPLALPWMTGKAGAYALYARVRAVTAEGASKWSTPFGFNTAGETPAKVVRPTEYPGLVRWTPVDGATGYQVFWVNLNRRIVTLSTAADEREFYTLHQQAPYPTLVRWRVRAMRVVYGSLPNALPAVSYGPWSQEFTSINPTFPQGGVSELTTVGDPQLDTGDTPDPVSQTPAFLLPGSLLTSPQFLNPPYQPLYHVYIATDKECVNVVYNSPLLGSPAYAPRPAEGLLALPADPEEIAKALLEWLLPGAQANVFMRDLTPVSPTETSPKVDLWDIGTSNGRYWWTVVAAWPARDGTNWAYVDAELPQDACASGRVASFGKMSMAVPENLPENNERSAAGVPYASGLSRDGRLVSATTSTPVFYGNPLVAWQPAAGAGSYEVQWSKQSGDRWHAEGTATTEGDSVMLGGSAKLTPGVWYYRVRGVDPLSLDPRQKMSWSDEAGDREPAKVVVAKPNFKIVGKLPKAPRKPSQ